MAWTHLSFAASVAVTFAAALAIPACGSSSQGTTPAAEAGTDAGGAVDAPVGTDAADAAEASQAGDGGHYPMPQIVNLANGPVLKTPKVYLVFYPGYTYETQIKAMAQALGASSYWAAVGKDYGVGAVQVAGAIDLTGETPPGNVADADIQTYLGGKLTSGAFGTPDPSAIYTIFYPSTTTITLPQGGLGGGNATSCTTFGGYHSDFTLTVTDGGQPQDFAYAVIPTCPSLQGMTEQDGVTGAVSHERIEASTDPFPSTNGGANSAYAQVDDNHFIWIALGGGGEVGDMRVGEQGAFYKPTDVGFMVQRSWSNSFAKAGHDPCVPNIAGAPYFQSAPQLNENISFTPMIIAGTIPTQGVTIPVGKSKTIAVDLYSDLPTSGPWTVATIDLIAQYFKQPASLTFKWDKTQGQNGDRLELTITVTSAQPLFGGGHPFIITSTLGSKVNQWAGLVVE